MALDKTVLEGDLKAVFSALKSNDNQEDSIDVFASELANVIHNYVSKAEVQAGQDVTTTGSATAQTGKTISNGVLI